MSRIGYKPIKIESPVKLSIDGKKIVAEGPKGKLEFELRHEIGAKMDGDLVRFEILSTNKKSGAYLGMARSIVNGMAEGVVKGFEKKLELVGVGYRAKMAGSDVVSFSVGYSHPVEYKLPSGISAEVIDNTQVIIRGADKQLVGQVAANMRKIRKPEPYKGKGIKYSGEVIRRKQGKSGKV